MLDDPSTASYPWFSTKSARTFRTEPEQQFGTIYHYRACRRVKFREQAPTVRSAPVGLKSCEACQLSLNSCRILSAASRYRCSLPI